MSTNIEQIFNDANLRRNRRADIISSLRDPIPAEIRDTEELSLLFERWNLVPYAGADKWTGHSTLAWYLMLARLSPTNGAAIEKMCKYAFGSRARFVRAENPDFDLGEEHQPLSRADALAYEQALTQQVVFDGGVRDLHRLLAWSLKATGNAWVEVSIATLRGQSAVVLRYVRQTNVMYVRTQANEPKAAAISPIWTDAYLRKYPPVVIPLYPNFVEVDGVRKTLFHLKTGDYNWYGRPDSQSADLYKFREVQDGIYLTRQAATNFTGQLIIEVEDDGQNPAIDEAGAQAAGFDSFAERLQQNFTNQGDNPMSVLVASRPFGSKPMFVFQLKPNTSEQWYKITGEIAESYILSAHGLTLRFLGKDVSNGFSQDAFIADYVMNVEPVVMELRRTVTVFVNQILNAIWAETGREELSQFSLDFTSPIQSQVEAYRSLNSTAQANV